MENSEREGNTRPPDLLRTLYAGQEATVRTGHGTTAWFQIGKGVHQGSLNAGLEEAQAGIEISGRNINNLRYEMTPPYGRK